MQRFITWDQDEWKCKQNLKNRSLQSAESELKYSRSLGQIKCTIILTKLAENRHWKPSFIQEIREHAKQVTKRFAEAKEQLFNPHKRKMYTHTQYDHDHDSDNNNDWNDPPLQENTSTYTKGKDKNTNSDINFWTVEEVAQFVEISTKWETSWWCCKEI